MQEIKTSNNIKKQDRSSLKKRMDKSVRSKALLAALLVFLTVVVMFAITAAWYTNIAHTGGLVFEAEQWGFEGTVELNNSVLAAAPGDEGYVSLTATSKSDAVTAIGVNISKAFIEDEEIHKRLYFYVDTSKVRNGETLERVYLNNNESYTYTLFPQGTLTLTEEVYNDARIKWHWVYDVLGYYVLGTMTENGTVSVSEYLRPIEYNYDDATTTFEYGTNVTDDGERTSIVGTLETVDGVTRLAEFLIEISKKDGYAGTIDPTIQTSDGFYPVSVDETGYGVWAYMCSYSDIEQNNNFDTNLAASAVKAQYPARIVITAQNTNYEAVEVNTAAGLMENINKASDEKQFITLTNDLVLSEAITLSKAEEVMIDLNGHKLSLPDGTGIDAKEGSTVTIVNGTIKTSGTAVNSCGAEVTLSGVTMDGAATAVRISDDAGHSDSFVRIVGCTLNTKDQTLYIRGNGTETAQKTVLVVENSSICSEDYIGITGNGNATNPGCWGTDIQIINSTVYGKWAGIYQPQKDSGLTISNNSVVSGYTGIALKGGSLNVANSTVKGTGAQQAPAFGGSGFSDTGDGIYIETNYGYETVLEVRGNSVISSDNGYALQVYEADANNVSVKIYGGTFTDSFNTDVSQYVVTEDVSTIDSIINDNSNSFFDESNDQYFDNSANSSNEAFNEIEETIDNNSTEVTEEPVEDDSTEVPAESVEDNSTEVPAEPVEGDSTEVSTESVEDNSTEVSTESVEDNSTEVPAEPVEGDSTEVPDESVVNDSTEATAEPVEDNSSEVTEESAESVENNCTEVPEAPVENSSNEVVEGAEENVGGVETPAE